MPKETIAFRAEKRTAARITQLAELFDDPVRLRKGTVTDVLNQFCEIVFDFIDAGIIEWSLPWLQGRLQRKQAYGANGVNGANGFRPLLKAVGERAVASSSERLGPLGKHKTGPLLRSASHPDWVLGPEGNLGMVGVPWNTSFLMRRIA